MPFIFDYSGVASMGAAGALAGDAQAQWKNQGVYLQQQQQERDNAYRQQQANNAWALQVENMRQEQMQNAQAEQWKRAQFGEGQRQFDQTMQWRDQNIASQTQRNENTVAGQNYRANLNDMRLREFKDVQSAQFLAKHGLDIHKAASLNAWRDTQNDIRLQQLDQNFQIAMANAQTREQQLQITVQHYNQLAALQQQAERGRNERSNAYNMGTTVPATPQPVPQIAVPKPQPAPQSPRAQVFSGNVDGGMQKGSSAFPNGATRPAAGPFGANTQTAGQAPQQQAQPQQQSIPPGARVLPDELAQNIYQRNGQHPEAATDNLIAAGYTHFSNGRSIAEVRAQQTQAKIGQGEDLSPHDLAFLVTFTGDPSGTKAYEILQSNGYDDQGRKRR